MLKQGVRSAILISLLALGHALEVSPGSPCASRCLDKPAEGDPNNRDDSLTWNTDLSCFDWQYTQENGTDVGKKFADCQACMQASAYEDNEWRERDTGWFMFNNKGTIDWCLFGKFAEESNPNITDTFPYRQCNTACRNIQSASDFRIKSDPRGYEFCDHNGDYTTDPDECISCLYNTTGLTILGNILSTTREMCKTKPGKIFDYNHNVYTASRLQISSITSSSSASSTTAPSQSPVPNPSSESSADSGISKGAIAGIVLGALIGIIVVLVGILLMLKRAKKRRAATLKGEESGASDMPGSNPYNEMESQGKNDHPYQGGLYETDGHTSPVELSAGRATVELPSHLNRPGF
ncbi:hypothetical protein BS50DRAFT_626341 [Corynespora cassiicola Philippines]|uniref:WSC domain-containing protein n=1 Tax=Corynespora cassiicola Philippines TaxID=1448308 RepID=A0A2T2N3Q0_CORCC|nr:hypothetical protein BS50DRAFT_626341 [Corynespora cassiicola Philippines]